MVKFKKVSADEARAKRSEHTKDVAGGTAIVKGFRAPPSWNSEARSARFIMSSESIDRYADIVVQGGMEIDRFLQNPVGLLFHNSRSWPCGNWSDITKVLSGRPKRTEGTLNFLPEGTDEDADRAARHVAAGSLRTVSIGFRPDWEQVEFILDDDEDWTGGFRFNVSELLECSVVPIPAQPDALVKDAGGDMQLARDLIEDILDNYAKTPEGLLIPLDEYRAKYMDLVGNRASAVIERDFLLLPAEKNFSSRNEREIRATTDEEAQAFVGAKVIVDPANPANKDWPFVDALAKAEGEIFSSFIVDHGPNMGVHALSVEFISDEYSGMFRGIKAERFLLAEKHVTAAEPEATEDQPFPAAEESRDAGKSIEVTIETNLGETRQQFEELETTVERVEKRVDGLLTKFAKLFGFGKEVEQDPVVERTEPPLETTIEPTVEEIDAARTKAREALQRLANKGMIAA